MSLGSGSGLLICVYMSFVCDVNNFYKIFRFLVVLIAVRDFLYLDFLPPPPPARQGMLEPLVSWLFYLPGAIAVPPEVYFFYRSVNTVYQFWVHTQLVGTLGPLEWVRRTENMTIC